MDGQLVAALSSALALALFLARLAWKFAEAYIDKRSGNGSAGAVRNLLAKMDELIEVTKDSKCQFTPIQADKLCEYAAENHEVTEDQKHHMEQGDYYCWHPDSPMRARRRLGIDNG